MKPKEILACLEAAEVFGELSHAVLQDLSSHFSGVNVDKGAFLFFEGDQSERIYVACQGRIKIIRHSVEGKEVLIEVVPEGRPFALLAGIEGLPLSASAVAMEDCRMLSVGRERFLDLMATHPELSLAVIRDLAGRLRDARDRIRSLALERVEQRIARALVLLAERIGVRRDGRVRLDLSLTRQDIASMVGTTVESAIRTMSRFQKDSILRTEHGSRIEILDLDAIKKLASPPESIPHPKPGVKKP